MTLLYGMTLLKCLKLCCFSRLLAGEGGLIITLRGPSLISDVNAVLSPNNNYSVDVFTNQLEKIMQSNSDVRVDDRLHLNVSIARSKQGGVYRYVI